MITFFLENFTLTFFIIGLVSTAIILFFKTKPLRRQDIVEVFFVNFLFFPLGLASIYNFVFHVFFGDLAAHFIGWENSPFQLEVGFASLGFGITFIMAVWQNIYFRAASIIGPSVFYLGAAAGHIYQMISAKNFEPGNAGIMFWSGILFPIISFTLLWLQYKYTHKDSD